MTIDILQAKDSNDATLVRGSAAPESLHLHGVYFTECFGPDGVLKWSDVAHNLVTNQGKGNMMDQYFAGTTYTGSFVMSLITAGTALATSVYATPTVTEIATGIVTSNTRPAITWTAAASGTKSATTTSFGVTGSATITGNMVLTGGTGVATVGNTSATGGVLFSSAAFSGGSKTVNSGDTLNVSYSLSI